jgi:hypothetical protein
VILFGDIELFTNSRKQESRIGKKKTNGFEGIALVLML